MAMAICEREHVRGMRVLHAVRDWQHDQDVKTPVFTNQHHHHFCSERLLALRLAANMHLARHWLDHDVK